jgi:hypothetical protein
VSAFALVVSRGCKAAGLLSVLAILAMAASAQDVPPLPQSPAIAAQQSQSQQQTQPPQQTQQQDATQATPSAGQQTHHIFGVIPNYRAVSANDQSGPLTVKQKFLLSAKDSLDYGSIVFAAGLASYDQATRAYPEFGNGIPGYSRYFWRSFADQGIGNLFTEGVMPSFTKEDPRYFTMEKGGFWRRLTYAAGRLIITKTDSGGTTFNFSEILGNGMAAGISDAYYPARERTAWKTVDNWGTQIGADGVANIVKEFWPDIRRKLFKK